VLKTIMTRVCALIAAFLAFSITLVITEIGSKVLAYALQTRYALRAVNNYPLVVDFIRMGAVFYWGYPFAVALTTAFFFWRGWPREQPRLILYLLVLLTIGPLTYINYLVSDQWLNLWLQAAFNLFVAFSGYTIVLKIRALRTTAADASALKSLSILALTSLMIALPLFYTSIFLASALHMLTHKQVGAINENVPLLVSGSCGAIAVLLSNLDRLRTSKSKPGDN